MAKRRFRTKRCAKNNPLGVFAAAALHRLSQIQELAGASYDKNAVEYSDET
jgi:hypothetical protein